MERQITQVDARAGIGGSSGVSVSTNENFGRASASHAIRGVSVSTPRVGGSRQALDFRTWMMPKAMPQSLLLLSFLYHCCGTHHSFAPSLSPSSHQLRVPGRSAADEVVASQRTTHATNVRADSVASHQREAAFQ